MDLLDSGHAAEAATDGPGRARLHRLIAEHRRRRPRPPEDDSVESNFDVGAVFRNSDRARLQQLGLVHAADRVADLHEGRAEVRDQGERGVHRNSFLDALVLQHSHQQDFGHAAQQRHHQHHHRSEDCDAHRFSHPRLLLVRLVPHRMQQDGSSFHRGRRHHLDRRDVLRIPFEPHRPLAELCW